MCKRLTILTILGLFVYVGASLAASGAQEYSKSFEIDLEAPLPTQQELIKKYVVDKPDYDNRYSFGWNIGKVFDDIFNLTIVNYGNQEKRLKPQNEEVLLDLLSNLPKESYEYIGPYLHTVQGISEKVLNLPGIKETKNKFPSRIAPQLKDIEDLEFLSPYLYFVLMPEAWPDNYKPVERPKRKLYSPKIVYDPKFYERIDSYVSVEEFVKDDNSLPKVTKSDLRTLKVTKNSPLTSADVKAFNRSLSKVSDFGKSGDNFINLIHVGGLFNVWEQEQGKGLPVNAVKDLVNPCQRLVQKVKIIGKELDFAKTVSTEGFDVNGWAYTCDKTIKAYRVSRMSSNMLLAIKSYQKGIYDTSLAYMNDKNRALQFSTMQSAVEMHKAPMNDVLEVIKNRKELEDELSKMQNMLIVSPITRL